MKLTYIGTRGNIEPETRRHKYHTSLLIQYKKSRIMIDCGANLDKKVFEINPDAIVITHSHPDHIDGLKECSPSKVFLTEESYNNVKNYGFDNHKIIDAEKPFKINDIQFEAYSVEHSLNAPANGFKIKAGEAAIFYVPDLVFIHNRDKALKNIQLYIGDGATISRSFIRKKGERLIGHTPVPTQLTWCEKYNIPKAVITHCGSEIVGNDERKIGAKVKKLAKERNVDAKIAYDGMEMILR